MLNDRDANLDDEQKPCPPIALKTIEEGCESQEDPVVLDAQEDEDPVPTKLHLLRERAQRHCRFLWKVLATDDSNDPLSMTDFDVLRQDCIETAQDMNSITAAREQREEQTSPVRSPLVSVACF